MIVRHFVTSVTSSPGTFRHPVTSSPGHLVTQSLGHPVTSSPENFFSNWGLRGPRQSKGKDLAASPGQDPTGAYFQGEKLGEAFKGSGLVGVGFRVMLGPDPCF